MLGEKYILTRLFRRIGFAALLVYAGNGDATTSGVLRIIGATLLFSGLLPLFAIRGRHLAWVVFFAIGGIALWCA